MVIQGTNGGVAAWTRHAEKIGKSSKREKLLFWPDIFSDRVSGKDAWYEGAGID